MIIHVTEILEQLLRGDDLTQTQAHAVMQAIMSGTLGEAQISALLIALRTKGEGIAEIAGFAAAMREAAVKISPAVEGAVDTCGTGGDGRHTFNVSTATALLTAALGIPVAKHGNRAVSSRCGSADLLEALGVNVNLSPAAVTKSIETVGIGFLFAPHHHPAMKYAAPVRKQLGVRTVFNILGPLTNPAGVKRQLLGVYREDLTEPLAHVLKALGSERAFVVHGLDGTDEVSISGETLVSALAGGQVHTFRFTPEEAGLARADLDQIAGGAAEENAAHLRALFAGQAGARRDATLLNTGFVVHLAGRATDVRAGVVLAAEAIDDGRASALLDNLVMRSQQLAKEESA